MRVLGWPLLSLFVLSQFPHQGQCRNPQSATVSQRSDFPPATTSLSLHGSVSSTMTATPGCVVYVASVVTYNWQPAHFPNFTLPSGVTPSSTVVPTDREGTHLGTVIVTTGAYEKSGTWTPLTSITTLTFPTAYTNIPNQYVWLKTSGTISGRSHSEMMPVATPYTDANATATPVPSDDPKGLGWNLASIPMTADPAQVSWLRSVYPDVSWLRDCYATAMFDRNGRPPIAQQALSLIQRPAMSTEAAVTTTKTRKTMEPITTISRPRTPAVASTQTRNRHGKSTRVVKGPEQAPQSTMSSSLSTEQPGRTKTKSSSTSLIQLHDTTQTEIAMSSSTAQHSNANSHHSKKPQRSTSTTPATTSEGVDTSIPGISITGGHVVYSGHTMSMGETATLGSGRTITRIALETDNAGATVIAGDTITSSLPMSPSVEPSNSNLPAPFPATSTAAYSSPTPPHTVSASSNQAVCGINPASWFNVVSLAAMTVLIRFAVA